MIQRIKKNRNGEKKKSRLIGTASVFRPGALNIALITVNVLDVFVVVATTATESLAINNCERIFALISFHRTVNKESKRFIEDTVL